MSTGAKAGIGAGIGAAACLVIAGLLFFCMRRRKAARDAQGSSEQSQSLSGGQGQALSQTSRVARRQNGAGVVDYFGPAATAGPYTDHETPGSSPYRAVPMSPDGPSDIVGVVEIGHSREHSNVTSPGEVLDPNAEYLKSVPETTKYRAELP